MESAAEAKAEGNKKFQAKEFQAAIDAYSRSLELDPTQHLCYSNRSAAYLKLGDRKDEALMQKALQDAEKCIELMPSFAKGYNRVATALQELKVWDKAIEVCRRGIVACEKAEDKASLEKSIEEVPKWRFCDELSGVWHGTVNEVLGGYDQEMEFLDTERVRIEVLGRGAVGSYWVSVSEEPHHLNIQVPVVDIPPGMPPMPPPPPVPYIARIDEVGLHLCCPYLKMERPTSFTGPGYVLMKRGGLAKPDDSEVTNLSSEEKLQRCAQELYKALPDSKIDELEQGDSEAVAGEKLMAQVRFESSMYNVKQQFGEETMKTVLAATKGTVFPELAGAWKEIQQLVEKLRRCGLLEDDAANAASSKIVSGPASVEAPKAAFKEAGNAAPPSMPRAPKASSAIAPSGEEAGSGCGPAAVGAAASVAIAALAAAAFMFSKRNRS